MKPFLLFLFFLNLQPIEPVVVQLGNGFTLEGENEYRDGNNEFLVHCKLFRNNQLLFQDTTNRSFYFGNHDYPLTIELNKNEFLVFLVYDDRPIKNKSIMFSFKNDLLTRLDTIPEFFIFGKNLDQDPYPEYAGIWDFGEQWDKVDTLVTGYNPIILYQNEINGLVIDSVSTELVNKTIYGSFFGFSYDARITFPVSKVNSKFTKEYQRLISIK